MAKVGRFRFGFELKTAVSVRFSDPERTASATRAAHDPQPHVSARLNSTLQYRAKRFSAAAAGRGAPAPRPAAALKRSVRQFSNYSSAQVIFKGGM